MIEGAHQVEGWWCPPIMTGPAAYLRRSLDLDRYTPRVRKPRVAVQAGGHIGIYPRILAERFQRVHTFEPDWVNFACLAMNAALPNVYAARAALGPSHAGATIHLHGKNTGGHQISAAGPIPMVRIDDIGLDQCDAIFLDLEGYEIPALKGAMTTLAKHRPLLVIEENKQMRRLGFIYGDIEKLVQPIGYRLIERVGEDIVLECSAPV